MFKTKIFLLALVGIAFAAATSAQWIWLDENGRKVFSDRAPSIDVPAKNVLKQPGQAALEVTPAASAPMAKASSWLKPTSKEPSLEAKKKQADEQEAAKAKAQNDKNAAAKAENCARAKQSLSTLQSGIRMATANAAGERVVMDDAAKAAETKRLQEIVDSDCK